MKQNHKKGGDNIENSGGFYKLTTENTPSKLLLEKRKFMFNYEFATVHLQ